MKRRVLLILISLTLILFFGCNNQNLNDDNTNKKELEETEENSESSGISEKTEEELKEIIEPTATTVLETLKNKEMDKLSTFVHSKKGVRFSPYSHIVEDKDKVFIKEEIETFLDDDEKYLWGQADGTGEDLLLTTSEYYDQFVYSVNYVDAEEVSYNRIIGTGNSKNNQFEIYPDAIIVEYYFSGFDPQFDGMDWKSLKLVFEKEGNNWKLVGIINNQWTI